MAAYDVLARFYDALMPDVDYAQTAQFYQAVFDRFGCAPQIVLDLACGTGALSVELARCGYEVIGCDASESMLAAAAEKKQRLGLDILFLHQSMQELDLYGTVDAVVCNLDAVNHIPPETLPAVFDRVSLFLAPGGLFVFDVDSEYKFSRILGNETFVYDLPAVYCVWQNAYRAGRLQIHLDLFSPVGGKYRRETEDFCEYYHSDDFLCRQLSASGLELLGRFADYALEPVGKTTQRIHYVAQKRRT